MSIYQIKAIAIFAAFFTLFIFSADYAAAHPGRTDSSGCHTCRTNCPDWGLSYGEYHCHNGGRPTPPVQIYNTPTPRVIYIPPTPTLTPTSTPTNTPTPTSNPISTLAPTLKQKENEKTTTNKNLWEFILSLLGL